MSLNSTYDVVVVGAGFAGMYALHSLRSKGFSVLVIEAGSGVGGTWYWNRYPGARCDVNSLEYSYQFSEELQQEWSWTEKYAPQAEILEYANHVADRFDLRRDIQFDTRIEAMHFDAKSDTWNLTTDKGTTVECQFSIMATGCLSKQNIPDFEGLDNFDGDILHTGDWPKQQLDFSHRRVGIIGTGSSAIQAIPLIAERAGDLTIFQRTACFSVPARNAPTDKKYEQEIKSNYSQFRAENSRRYSALDNHPSPNSALDLNEEDRARVYEERWRDGGLSFLASFNDLGFNSDANKTASDFVHSKIKNIVNDPAVAESLCPTTILGCKRLCVDTDYYQTFNRDNVHLVDVSQSGIEKITPKGVVANGCEYELDALILATGFDAMTGALLSIDIQGLDGQTLRDKWQHGPENYLGLTVNGFPNLFMITGPGSPSVLANMIVAIEQHVDWISDCLEYLRDKSLRRIDAESAAEESWVSLVNQIAETTLFLEGCNSWYTGANIPGKPRIFMPYLGYPAYVDKCDSVAAGGYSGFKLT